jgi:Mg-chelatase subunit ChlD
MNRTLRLAAFLAVLPVLAVALALASLFAAPARAQDDAGTDLAPEGGRLEALDLEGNPCGPCPLENTDVQVHVSGLFARSVIRQRYRNPFPEKIEAVYTFPLPHRAAVDRMRLVVGDRLIEGEVHERDRAREIYRAARAHGHVASLLEQERPNVFTQSVANIEPGATVLVEIHTVEILSPEEGEYRFDFPTVVGPRYVPGLPDASSAPLPAGRKPRRGLVLLAPAALTLADAGDVSTLGSLQIGKLHAILHAARPIQAPPSGSPALWHRFEAAYADGSRERGELYTDGTGQIGGRWFTFDAAHIQEMGTGYSPDTDRVPDASRITPMPVRPGTRSGHDLSIRVTIETGGPAITKLSSALHAIRILEETKREDGRLERVSLELARAREIPNRDFVLSWRIAADAIEEAAFTHPGDEGNFVTIVLAPPDRVAARDAVPREIVFVLDTSGSMSGLPIEKSKEVIHKAIDSLRAQDTYNLVTFSGDTHVLWSEPRPATSENRAAAQRFLSSRRGGGGTEMMKAIEAALAPGGAANRLSETAAPIRIACFLTDGFVGNDLEIVDAVKRHAATARVFGFGIGQSVNRFLLDAISKAGRGEVEYVLLGDDADEKVARFVRRIATPVLTDIAIEFSPNLGVEDVLPARIPDLFDLEPIVVHGRYRSGGIGSVTIRGNTGAGPFARTVPLDLASAEPRDVIATLWARAKVEEILDEDLATLQAGSFPESRKREVVELGERFRIVTPFTSFVAVEKLTVTIGGEPVLVAVPVEMPEGVDFDAVFGKEADACFPQGGFAGFGLQGRLGRGATLAAGLSPSAGGKRHVAAEPVSRASPQLVRSSEFLLGGIRERAFDELEGESGPVDVEQWVARVAELASAGKLEDARALASKLIAGAPGLEAGKRLLDALRDGALDPAESSACAAAARKEAEAAHEKKRRAALLERRLDERLRNLASRPADASPPQGLKLAGGRLAIVILVDRADAEMRRALEAAGVAIEAVASQANVVVGLAAPQHLETIALLDGVRRVEPVPER